MPVWRDVVRPLIADDKLVVIGVTQEQHPDRCRLFAQWKDIDWPILHDPINAVGVEMIPIAVSIDEHGIVRSINPSPRYFEVQFVNRSFEPPANVRPARVCKLPDPQAARTVAKQAGSAAAWRRLGNALLLDACATREGTADDSIGQAIRAYERALDIEPKDAAARFRLGVAYRMRYDSAARRPRDFQQAVDTWRAALKVNLNQYIYRRRIQQYGPRLDKPYPFYDWIETARREVAARGETPVELAAEPVGAERAGTAERFSSEDAAPPDGDPDGKVKRDDKGYIQFDPVVVRATGKRSRRVVQVHLTFRPNPNNGGHWNNEAGPLRIWLQAPEGIRLSRAFLEFAPPPQAVTNEPRTLSVEVELPDGGANDPASPPISIAGYALYNVCEGRHGQCLFRRQDLELQLGWDR
ncbi:MAG: hypothetical protein V3T70_11670 [Phycisphaerae bacterium]